MSPVLEYKQLIAEIPLKVIRTKTVPTSQNSKN